MFIDKPLLGHGLHTFGSLYPYYLSTLEMPAWALVDLRGMPWPHNLYLEVLAEAGLVGAIALAVMLAAGIRLAWKVRKCTNPGMHVHASAALAGLLGICCAAVYELSLLRLWVLVVLFSYLGIVAGLSRMVGPKLV